MKNKLCKKTLICILMVIILLAFIIINIYFSCVSESKYANIFTAIAGWVGFFATAGIGVITLWQNKQYEQRSYIQYHADKLLRARDIIYSDMSQLINSDAILDSRIMRQFAYGSSLPFYKESIQIISLRRQCTAQIHDIYSLRYQFNNSLPLTENLCEFVYKVKELSNRFQINSIYEECVELFEKVKQNYFDLLVEMDDVVQTLLNKNLKFKDFEKRICELESCESQRKQLREIIDKYNNLAGSENVK